MERRDGKITRRAMLTRSAQAAGLVALASNLAPLFADRGSRGFKIGACEWSLGKGDPSCFEVAKEIGLDGVQLNMGSVGNDMHLRRPEVQNAYRESAKRHGLEMASLAIGEMNSVPLKSDPRAAQWLLDSIDVCKALGIPISMPACFSRGDLDMAKTDEIDHLVQVLKLAATKAEKAGIVIGLESYLSAEDNLKILDRVASPALKVYYDVGNSTDKGRDVLKEIPLLGNRICEFHAKDDGFALGQGKGRIDFRAVRKAMDTIQYRGWIQLESAHPKGIVPDYRAQCQFLKGIFPARV
jgi:sugar phosphate isomerase/epimerase